MSFNSQRHTINTGDAALKRQRQRGTSLSTREAIAGGASNHALSRTLGGAPLEPRVRAEMEARFGESFAEVRVHNDSDAHRSAAELDAKAYTVGNNIAFSAERYAPYTMEGKRLLAHELAHVVQQRRGGAAPSLSPRAAHEAGAAHAAWQVASGTSSVQVAGATGIGVSRELEQDDKRKKKKHGATRRSSFEGVQSSNSTAIQPRQSSASGKRFDTAERKLQPGPEYWLGHTPDFAAMSPLQLLDEAKQINEWLNRQISTSPESIRMEQLRDELQGAGNSMVKKALGPAKRQRAKGRKAKQAAASQAASLPRILRERSSIDTSNPDTLEAEFNEIVTYLQNKEGTVADRRLLQAELMNLFPGAGRYLHERAAQRRGQVIEQALTSTTTGEGVKDLAKIAQVADRIRPLQGNLGANYLMLGNEQITLSDAEVGQIRASLLAQFDATSEKIHSMTEQAQAEWRDFHELNYDEHPVVGFAVSVWSGQDASDIYERMMPEIRKSNMTLSAFKKLRDEGAASLGSMADTIVDAAQLGANARQTLDQGVDHSVSAAGDIVWGLRKLKTAGQFASYTFSPLGAAAYAGTESLAEQASEVHYGQRESIDYLGVGLDAGANFIGAKLGGLVPGARAGAGVLERAGLWALRDRVTAATTTAGRMTLANAFEEGNYSIGDVAHAAGSDLVDVKGLLTDAVIHQGSQFVHARSQKGGQSKSRVEREEGQSDEPKSQATATVLTQKPQEVKPLDLPVIEINEQRNAKGTRAEVAVPFEVYKGPEWNHIAGGPETASSRINIGRDTGHGGGESGGIDFIVENVKTGRLVIGEQKALEGKDFSSATAISTSLKENVTHARERIQEALAARRESMHPEEVARLEKTIGRLEATENALESGSPLPEGVVFEFTRVEGQSETIGKGHVDMLSKVAGEKNPTYAEHLLSRTFVRDPKLAESRRRDLAGKRGADADPDVVPALDLLTPEARDTLERHRAGKNEKQWEAKKAKDKERESDARRAKKEAEKEERKTEEREAWSAAEKEGEKTRKERLKQLKEERALRNEPEPTTKRQRDQAKSRMEREAKEAGRAERDKAFGEFKEQRRRRDNEVRAQRKADEKAKAQERAQKRKAAGDTKKKRDTQQAQVKAEKQKAIDAAKKAGEINEKGTLKTPESILEMNKKARAEHEAETRASKMGKAAHGINTAAAGLRAIDKFNEERKKGKSYAEASYEAGKTYLENTNAVVGAIGIAQSRMQKDEKGEQYYGDDAVDAWLGTIGETAAGYIVPGGGIDQLVNAGANLSGAVDDHLKRGVDPNDPTLQKANLRTVTDLAADMTPSRMFSQVLGGGLRSYYDIGKAIGGDTHGVDKFGEDAVRGKLGSIIQPWAMVADFAGNLGSDNASTALEKTIKKTEGTTLKKLGDASGDAMYELGQSKEAKSGKYGPSVQGISMMLGMGSDMVRGDSFEQALNKAADAGKGSIADTVGSALGDAAFVTVEKTKEFINEDIPAAKKKVSETIDKTRDRLSKWWNSF